VRIPLEGLVDGALIARIMVDDTISA